MTTSVCRITAVILCAVLCIGTLCAADTTPVPEPYDTSEFPQWANDITRFGLIAIGTLPFTTSFIGFGYKEIVTDWGHTPFADDLGDKWDEDTQKEVLKYSIYASLGCAVIDLFIQKAFVQRAERRRRQAERHGTAEIEEVEEFSANQQIFSGVQYKVAPEEIERSLKQSGGMLLKVPENIQ